MGLRGLHQVPGRSVPYLRPAPITAREQMSATGAESQGVDQFPAGELDGEKFPAARNFADVDNLVRRLKCHPRFIRAEHGLTRRA